jgi:2-polyprenyl-3-methyl-5-hydroxy-6-metoxy-1,4-benzoquinol methylase
MFLTDRSMQAEYFDLPGLPIDETAHSYQELDRINCFFQFSHPFVSQLPRWLGRQTCQQLKILDIGSGSGLLGRKMSRWAARCGWQWHFTNLDLNPVQPPADDPAHFVTGSALELPFPDNSFDLVIASQMTHHLAKAEIIGHWREAWRVSRDAVFICDLHRNAGLYATVWLGMRLLGISAKIHQDGLISVKRGFRCPEWRELAAAAAIPQPRIWLYYGTRIVMQARKAAR